MSRIAGGVTVLALVAAVYVLVPGHPDLPGSGVPVGASGTVVLSLLVFLAAFYRRAAPERRHVVRIAGILAFLVCAKFVAAAGVEPHGWSARYFANEHFAGEPQWSGDFRRSDITRIDRAISFNEYSFPVHYLNDRHFDRREYRRENLEPMSVEWSGSIDLGDQRREQFSLTARGTARLSVDGRDVLSLASTSETPAHDTHAIQLGAGRHRLELRYAKPANTAGLIAFRSGGEDVLAASSRPDGHLSSRVRLVAAAAIHVVFLFVVAWIGWLGERSTPDALKLRHGWRSIGPATERWLAVIVTTAFGVQGALVAKALIGRATVLTGGDDWFYYESGARAVLQGDLLMRFGAAFGSGGPYYSYPLYSYLLALVHRVSGEDLFAPVFLQFLVLAAVTLLVYRLIGRMLDPRAALCGVVALVALFELDFTRYYTVTLLSENVYILTVTATLLALARWTQTDAWRDLLQAALWGGISSITRPAMMAFLIPMLAFVAFASMKRRSGLGRTLGHVAMAGAAWMAVIAPVTLRNYVVSGQPVLIASGLGETFITYNLPPSVDPQHYRAMFTGGVGSSFAVLLHLFRDHPLEMLRIQLDKLSFSLGLVQSHQGYRAHPELVAATIVYAAAFVGWKSMRAPAVWPIHLFVLAHLAGMGLTQPWVYGYRLILPPYVYMSALSAGALVSLVLTRLPRRAEQGSAECH
jgi:dolichyl-phosphate-mannose-protein mannosyltransferase